MALDPGSQAAEAWADARGIRVVDEAGAGRRAIEAVEIKRFEPQSPFRRKDDGTIEEKISAHRSQRGSDLHRKTVRLLPSKAYR